MTVRFGVCRNRGLHRRRIEFAVGLCARPAHGRTFAAVENTELDAALVGDAPHQTIQSVDFTDQMAFAQPADRRIAGHGADSGKSVSHQRDFRAHASARGRGFTAGVAAADHDDIESVMNWVRHRPVLAEAGAGVKNVRFGSMFHVKHRQNSPII